MTVFRWRAVVPMALFTGLVILFWTRYVDHVIRRAIEYAGTELVGAKVELASARLRLAHADLILEGLQVTDPNQPMRNLVDASQIVADLNGRALLETKVVVETLAVRGVRFGTPRKESGAIAKPSPSSGLVTKRLVDWARGIPMPSLDLRGLVGTAVRVDAISADSLKTTKEVREAQAMADSLRLALGQTLRGLDPQPVIDSARGLSTQLGQADLRHLNPVQAASQANAVRAMIGRMADTRNRLAAARQRVDSSVARLHGEARALDDARQADYRYVRGLLHLPELGGPDISMALFGRMATERLQPLLYWMNLADQYVPPGLDPRRSSGPKRARMAGTTFAFPKAHVYPTFLLEHGDADLTIGGRTVAAGAYRAVISGVTTDPAVYGRPTFFFASRASGVGPHDVRVGGMMDHVGAPRDSVGAFVPSVRLPTIAIPAAHASLEMRCDIDLVLVRSGDELSGSYRMTSSALRWQRVTSDSAQALASRIGTVEWGQGLLWRSMSALQTVSIEARISGPPGSPHLDVASNVGDAVANSLREALGAELRKADADVTGRVDAVVGPQVAAARQRLAAVETDVAGRLGLQQQQLDQVQAELQQKLSQLGGGIRLPGIPGLGRP